MVTNVVVLSQHDVCLSGEVLANQLFEISDFRIYLQGAQCSPVHVLLCLLQSKNDPTWLETEMQPYLSCPVKLILLISSPLVFVGSQLARSTESILIAKELNESFLNETLRPMLTRLDTVYGDCFDLLLGENKTGKLKAEDLRLAAQRYGKPKDEQQVVTGLKEVAGREGAESVSKEEFVTWWRNGRKANGFLVIELANHVLQTSPILDTSGTDLRRMLLSPDSEEIETQFSGSLTFGELSDSPSAHLKCQLDIATAAAQAISLSLTLSVQESFDVALAKTALEDAVNALKQAIKPYDRNDVLIPYLNFEFSMGHRKVVATLTLSHGDGVWGRWVKWFESFLAPLLKCSFAQFVEVNVSSDVSLREMAEDDQRPFFEHLFDGVEVQVDVFYSSFYREMLDILIAPYRKSSIYLTMIMSALKDTSLELEFGSAEELPSFVQAAIHNALQRYGLLSLFYLRKFLQRSQHGIVLAVKQLLLVLAAKFDAKSLGFQGKFSTLSLSGELTVPGLFEAFSV